AKNVARSIRDCADRRPVKRAGRGDRWDAPPRSGGPDGRASVRERPGSVCWPLAALWLCDDRGVSNDQSREPGELAMRRRAAPFLAALIVLSALAGCSGE